LDLVPAVSYAQQLILSMMGQNVVSDTSCSESLASDADVIKEVDLSVQSDYETAATMSSENSCNFTYHKHLRFSEDDPYVIEYLPPLSELDPEQRKALWWSPQEYESFSDTARSISREVRKHQNLTCGLDEAYRQAEALSRQQQQQEGKHDTNEPTEEQLHQISVDSVSYP
jgi:hypothetical protein